MKFVGIVSHPKPADGIIYNQVDDSLVQAMERVGLIPVLIPITDYDQLDDYLHRVDALVFAGQTPVAPFFYGEEPDKETGELDLELDQFEMTLLRMAIHQVPILGIERGAHLINLALGGTLAPIDSKVIHASETTAYHSLALRKRSLFHDIYGSRLIVSSNHTHKIAELGDDLKPSAKSIDGVIEGFEHQDLPIIGIQFPGHELSESLSNQLFQAFRQL